MAGSFHVIHRITEWMIPGGPRIWRQKTWYEHGMLRKKRGKFGQISWPKILIRALWLRHICCIKFCPVYLHETSVKPSKVLWFNATSLQPSHLCREDRSSTFHVSGSISPHWSSTLLGTNSSNRAIAFEADFVYHLISCRNVKPASFIASFATAGVRGTPIVRRNSESLKLVGQRVKFHALFSLLYRHFPVCVVFLQPVSNL